MRSAVVFVAGVVLLAGTPAAAHAWWPYHPRLYHTYRPHRAAVPAAPIASPLYFQLPFGFGVNVSGLQVQGPLGNRINIGDQGANQPAPAPITIAAETKKDIASLKTDLSDLLKKTNKLSGKMYAPQGDSKDAPKPFEDLKETTGTTTGTSGGPKGGPKDAGGKSGPPGQ